MLSWRTLALSIALAIVLAIPAAALALSGPYRADPRPPVSSVEPDDRTADGNFYGWMRQMHDYMWSNRDFSDNFATYGVDWMNQFHNNVWGDVDLDGSRSWMGQMHDNMWTGGWPPVPFDAGDREPLAGSRPSPASLQGTSSVRRVPGPGWGGCGMWAAP
jgi:hypothetical protein